MTGRDDVLAILVDVGEAIGAAKAASALDRPGDVPGLLAIAEGHARNLDQLDPVAASVARQRIHAALHGDETIETTGRVVEHPTWTDELDAIPDGERPLRHGLDAGTGWTGPGGLDD